MSFTITIMFFWWQFTFRLHFGSLKSPCIVSSIKLDIFIRTFQTTCAYQKYSVICNIWVLHQTIQYYSCLLVFHSFFLFSAGTYCPPRKVRLQNRKTLCAELVFKMPVTVNGKLQSILFYYWDFFTNRNAQLPVMLKNIEIYLL